MEVKEIIAELDQEIARLREARSLLAGESAGVRRRGRPAGTTTAKTAGKSTGAKKAGKRNLTPEGRRRIQEALKRRWAERRKAVAKTEKPGKTDKAAKAA